MVSKVFHATGFKRALDLCKAGRFKEAQAVMKGLQDEFIAICDENEILKEQLTEVAEILDMAEKVEYDGQKYWLSENGSRKGPYCQVCYDRDGLLVHLQEYEKHFECQNCRSLYMIPRTERKKEKGGFLKTTLNSPLHMLLEGER